MRKQEASYATKVFLEHGFREFHQTFSTLPLTVCIISQHACACIHLGIISFSIISAEAVRAMNLASISSIFAAMLALAFPSLSPSSSSLSLKLFLACWRWARSSVKTLFASFEKGRSFVYIALLANSLIPLTPLNNSRRAVQTPDNSK